MKILFEAAPMVHGRKSGVGYYVSHLVESLAAFQEEELELTGYYFNFLNRKKLQLPNRQAIHYKQISLIPGKVISLCRRLGFQPFIELLIPKQFGILIFTNYVSLPLMRRRKSKVALVVYDLGFLDHPEFTQEQNLRFLQRFCPPSIRRADLVITISEFTKQRLLHYFPELRAKIVVTPIPPAQDSVIPKKINARLEGLGIKKEQYILYLGTIEPRKNLQALARAYYSLSEPLRKEYSLVLAGGKGWKDEAILSEIADLQARGANIIMPGYINDSEKAALYANAACFVLPSHYEGFGMPILEAMQYKTPVAVSDIPVFHEVAGDAALYFDKDDNRNITKALSTLLTDKSICEQLQVEGNKRLQTFSWQSNAQLITRAFNKLID